MTLKDLKFIMSIEEAPEEGGMIVDTPLRGLPWEVDL